MNDFITYLDGKIEEGKEQIAKLEADGRMDDANFAKVRTNIYDVCKTVSQALMNRPGAGVTAVQAQFDRFNTGWSAALEKAKQHDDIKNVAVEEIKLAALKDVMARCKEVAKE